MQTKGYLYDALFERQSGNCGDPDCGKPITDRFTTHIDRIVEGKEGGGYVLDNCRLLHASCHQKRHGNIPSSPYPRLASLYREYKFWQKKCNSARQQILAFSGDIVNTSASPYFTANMLEGLAEQETLAGKHQKAMEKAIHQELMSLPLAKKLLTYPGVGEVTLAMLLSSVNIRKAGTISALWSYLGYTDEKRKNGKGVRFHAPLYAALSITLLRKESPYRPIYDELRLRVRADGKPMGYGPALFRVIKVWLSHLWVTWRELEGLPISAPYIDGKGNHAHMYLAEDFGWKQPDAVSNPSG